MSRETVLVSAKETTEETILTNQTPPQPTHHFSIRSTPFTKIINKWTIEKNTHVINGNEESFLKQDIQLGAFYPKHSGISVTYNVNT